MSIYINQRIIDYYNKNKEEIAEKIDIKKALFNRLNRYSPNVEIKSYELAKLDYIEDAIVYSITTSNILNHEIIKNYCVILWHVFCENPFIAYESKIFHKEISSKIFPEEQLKQINEFKIKMSTKVIDELNYAFNEPYQTISSEALRIAKYQININNPNDGNLCEKLYNYLLNNYEANDNIYAKEYIINYTAYLAAKISNTPMPYVYLSNYHVDNKPFPEKTAGISKGNSGIIVVNYDVIENNISDQKEIPAIISFMEAILHEFRHSAQAYEMVCGDKTHIAFDYARIAVFREHLSSKDYDEYNKNYSGLETEIDAEKYGWKNVCDIITSRTTKDKHPFFTLIKTSMKIICKNLLTIKKEKNCNRLESWEYNVKKLNDLVSQNPKLLNEYSQLKLVYNEDGSLKDILELLRNENSNKTELSKIYKDYYISFIKDGTLDKIDPLKISKNDQILLFNKIIELLNDEYQILMATIKIYDKYEKEAEKDKFDFVTINRVARIKYLNNYLKANERLIAKLSTRNHDGNSLVENLLLIEEKSKQLTDEYYVSLFKGITDSKVHSDIESLKEVKFNGQQTRKGRK